MKQKPLWLKWCIAVIPLVTAGIMYFVLPYFPRFTEYAVSRGLFSVVAFPLELIASLIPFSLTEAVVVLSVPTAITVITVFVIRLVKKGHPLKTLELAARFTVFSVSAALLMFMITDGGNFSRIPLGELLDLPNRQYTAEQLYTVTADLAQKASLARESLNEDENGCVELSVSKTDILKYANDCYGNISREYKFLKTGTTRVKGVALSHLWSYTGTTGVYCPWLLESSINTDIPVWNWGYTAAHEIAHTMGFAKEDECNFLAFLASTTSEQPDYVYSGYSAAFVYCSNALYRADKSLWASARKYCSAAVLRDLKAENEYWKGFEGRVMKSSQNVNDTFIKVNGVESGALSYNQMVELMLRYYDKQGCLS